jgi:hypothetical protein
MGAAPSFAGSRGPEQDGVFLCRDESDVSFFVRMNNTGSPVDVWAVRGIDEQRIITTSSGFSYFPDRIPCHQPTLLERPPPEPASVTRRKSRENRLRIR